MTKQFGLSIVSLALISTLTGCGALIPLALLGSGFGEFADGFGDIGASFEAFEQAFDEFEQQVEATPFVEVRLVNNSDVTAEVRLVSGIDGPDPGEVIDADLGFFSFIGEVGFGVFEIDYQTVLVPAGETATGEIRCGSVIGISAVAPIEDGADSRNFRDFDHGFGHDDDDIDLFVPAGTISFDGAGTSNDGFEGALSTKRFLEPATEGLDCMSGALVVTIDTNSNASVVDATTGELIDAADLGRGSISIGQRSAPENDLSNRGE